MLRFSRPLFFPQLVHLEDVIFKSWSGDSGSTPIYKLDWGPVDERKAKSYNFGDFPGTLPKTYDDWVKNFLFAIPTNYLDQINYSVRQAVFEWNAELRFDTMIREICLSPAISHIQVAFKLIADCLYDKETNYFYRNPDKKVAPHAMLYKFWAFQTGEGLIREHSAFNRIEPLVSKDPAHNDDSISFTCRTFLNDIAAFEKEAFKSRVFGETVTGPCKSAFDIMCVKVEDLDFKSFKNAMGLELLRAQWDNGRSSGIMNIDCGNLRRIGKTTFMRELVKKYREKCGTEVDIMMMTGDVQQAQAYKDLVDEGIITSVVIANLNTSWSKDIFSQAEWKNDIILAFSDEVPDAVTYISTSKLPITYVCGFYSCPGTTPITFSESAKTLTIAGSMPNIVSVT